MLSFSFLFSNVAMNGDETERDGPSEGDDEAKGGDKLVKEGEHDILAGGEDSVRIAEGPGVNQADGGTQGGFREGEMLTEGGVGDLQRREDDMLADGGEEEVLTDQDGGEGDEIMAADFTW